MDLSISERKKKKKKNQFQRRKILYKCKFLDLTLQGTRFNYVFLLSKTFFFLKCVMLEQWASNDNIAFWILSLKIYWINEYIYMKYTLGLVILKNKIKQRSLSISLRLKTLSCLVSFFRTCATSTQTRWEQLMVDQTLISR